MIRATSTTTRRIVTSIFVLISILTPVMAISSPLYAQSNETGQALEIGPTVINLTADPGETLNSKINLRDVSDTSLLVTASINDFTAQGEDGTPKIVLDEGEDNPYSIRSWISPITQFTLDSKELYEVPVTISVPADAAPGGYFGVVRFTGTPPDLDGTGVALSASLGTLVFIRVNGDAKEQISIAEFYTAIPEHDKTSLFEGSPIGFVVRLKNDGNVHDQPTGTIIVKDMFGNKVGLVNVNLPPRNILPGTIRKFEQQLDESTIGNKKLFGLYTAELTVTYGEGGETVTSSLQFWVIPWKLILVAVVGLVALFFGLKALIKRYNSHIIKQAQKRK